MIYNPEFLQKLDQHREKTIYARIISLTIDEDPVDQIEGQITTGSVNVDGNSAVRRTCSLSMVAQDVNINDYYWGLNTKFKLEIGVENKVDSHYPDIIWFKMGTYVITSFNASLVTNNYTISLQGKDKMCLLNGEVGGVINATTDFGTYDFTDTETGITTNYKYPIKKIIWDSVHAYANEPFHNIIINDLDELGLELLEYKYDTPMYLYRRAEDDEYEFYTMGDDGANYCTASGNEVYDLSSSDFIFDNLTESMLGYGEDATVVYREASSVYRPYVVAKIEYGYTSGYRTCDLVYAGDLIANIGDSFTSVLDKIKGMLGQFEYFYDLDGRFIFQRQKSLVNTVWTPQRRDGDRELYVESLVAASNSMYDFNGNILISSIQNNPNLLNLRNDYTVWGVRKGVTGKEYPVHMRYAIDNKPEIYADFNGNVWTVFSEGEIEEQNKQRVKRNRRAEIEAAWENFQRDYTLYPPSFWQNADSETPSIDIELKWWNMAEWAEYYKILFQKYPGNTHPYDWMQYYCKSYGNNSTFLEDWMGYQVNSTIIPNEITGFPLVSGPRSYQVMQVFFFEKNGELNYGYSGHSGCVHTYGQWLDAENFVNGVIGSGNPNDVSTWEYAPFDDNFPWEFSHENGGAAFRYVDGYNNPTKLREMRDKLGLYKIITYCYDPKIPDDLREQQMALIEEEEEYIDIYSGKYIYGLDWRELIYRMAIDYRRHNHDDGFEITLAKNNQPFELYSKGITGYEQYYTDMEGFWRELYNPLTDENEVKKARSYNYASYNRIINKSDFDNIYIQGVYKPIGKKVTSVAEELWISGVTYIKDNETDKYYPFDNTRQYYESNNSGFTFTGPRYGSSYHSGNDYSEFLQKVKTGQLYTRDIPSVLDLYKINSDRDGIYPYMDLYNYATDSRIHFLKNVNTSDPQNPTYIEITETPIISSKQKAGSYVLSNNSDTAYRNIKNKYDVAELNYNAISGVTASLNVGVNTFSISYDDVSNMQIGNESKDFTDILQAKLQDAWGTIDLVNKTRFVSFLQGLHSAQEIYQYLTMAESCAIEAIEEIKVQLIMSEGNFEYILYSDVLQTQTSTLLQNGYIYDKQSLYKMSDVIQNTELAQIYIKDNQIVDKLINYGLNNSGQKNVSRTKGTVLNYYIQYSDYYDETAEPNKRYWRKEVFTAPQSLVFWFDFLTGDGELRQFTTKAVGDRPKAINDTNVKSIYYRDTPKIIFTTAEKLQGMDAEKKTGYNYFQLPAGLENMFSISAQGIDAKNRIDELIFQHSYCTESITLSAIPIYYLDVNRRISVYDPDTGINGEYVVSKISFQLAYNGMMSISATKAPENSVTEREE